MKKGAVKHHLKYNNELITHDKRGIKSHESEGIRPRD